MASTSPGSSSNSNQADYSPPGIDDCSGPGLRGGEPAGPWKRNDDPEALGPVGDGDCAVLMLGSGAAESEVDLDEPDALPSKLHYSFLDLVCTLISILTYLFDLAMDCAIAYYFYHLGALHGIYHYWYFGLTIAFIVFPLLTMTGFSLRWYLMDADNPMLPEVSVGKWILRLVVLVLQFAPLLRYLDSIRYGLLSRAAGAEERRFAAASSAAAAQGQLQDQEVHETARLAAREKRIKYFTLMVYEDADATLLRLFEGFMESAPQLVLQIYILIKDPHASSITEAEYIHNNQEANAILKYSLLFASILSSLVSLAWSLVVYHRSIRYTYPEKNNLDLPGSVLQFLWHFSSITARVLALSLFASIYPQWVGVVCALHWALMSTWVLCQRIQACNTKCEELIFGLALGAIYIFSFFNAKDERTRYKYLAYYTFCFCENTILVVFWFLYAHDGLPEGYVRWYYYPGIVCHYLAFAFGIAFMVVYYLFFHPTGVAAVSIMGLRTMSLKRDADPKDATSARSSFWVRAMLRRQQTLQRKSKRSQDGPEAARDEENHHATTTNCCRDVECIPMQERRASPVSCNRSHPELGMGLARSAADNQSDEGGASRLARSSSAPSRSSVLDFLLFARRLKQTSRKEG